jgi:hypothetical protein
VGEQKTIRNGAPFSTVSRKRRERGREKRAGGVRKAEGTGNTSHFAGIGILTIVSETGYIGREIRRLC